MTKTHGFNGVYSTVEQRKFYNTYGCIMQRCNNKNNTRYCDYGGRGVKCEWGTFEEFRDDMRDSFQKKCKEVGTENVSIDRINVNGNYCKENCRWATKEEQMNNMTTNRFIEYKGNRYTMSEFNKVIGGNYCCTQARLDRGWTPDEAANGVKGKRIKFPKAISYNGKTYNTIKDLANAVGMTYHNLQHRLKIGWDVEDAIREPMWKRNPKKIKLK